MRRSFVCLMICILLHAVAPEAGRGDSSPAVAPVSGPPADPRVSGSLRSDVATTIPRQTESVPIIKIINDPIEPVNRAFFAFNNGFYGFFIRPLEVGYRFVFPDLVRKRITKVGYNLEYPVRFLNCLLVGEFKGSGVETGRFLINTTVGVVGIFDPASSWGMRKYDEDFGKTFAKYGAGWGFYLVMPIFGSSSGRDAIGGQLDSLADPASYVFLNYFFSFNDLSYSLPIFEQIDAISYDPYATDRFLWALSRKRVMMDLDENAPKGTASEERHPIDRTFDDTSLRPLDPHVGGRARSRAVRIASTGKELPYSLWLQRGSAPLVFVIPGAGTHRLADSCLAIVDMLRRRGFSVVAVSSPLNWEFIAAAGTKPVPGYPPSDARDAYEALSAIYGDLTRRYPGRITSASALGISVGGLQVLFMADLDTTGTRSSFHLSRIVAVDPPVDMCYAMRKMDEYYQSPLKWGPSDRYQRMETALLKASSMIKAYPEVKELPLDETEAHYVMGVAYRRVLGEMIYSSQRKHDLGVIKADFGRHWRRESVYAAIDKYSFSAYIELFLLPTHTGHDVSNRALEELVRSANLRRVEPAIRNNARIRAFTNGDEFVLSRDDLEWLRQTLGDRLVVFHDGTHPGNLNRTDVQDRIVQTLDDLKQSQK